MLTVTFYDRQGKTKGPRDQCHPLDHWGPIPRLHRLTRPDVPRFHFPDRPTPASLAFWDRPELGVFTGGSAGLAGVATTVLHETGDQNLTTGIRLSDSRHHSGLDAKETIAVDDATIVSDSQAAVACVNGYTLGALKTLLKATNKAPKQEGQTRQRDTPVHLSWCPDHAGIEGSERADREVYLAVRAKSYNPRLALRFTANHHLSMNSTTWKTQMKEPRRALLVSDPRLCQVCGSIPEHVPRDTHHTLNSFPGSTPPFYSVRPLSTTTAPAPPPAGRLPAM
ncbi:hypothetical protein B0J17DRAFT_718602 [Rhizoctonia solani]|nr:hypothetical protein B0J17DRAFT_718602 [Rhizoctonia solani]